MSRTRAEVIENVLKYTITLVAMGVVIVPIGWTFINSFKLSRDILTSTYLSEPTLRNYWVIFFDPESSVLDNLWNSIAVVSATLLITTVFGAFAGYGLLRFAFRRAMKWSMLGLLLFSRMLPRITAAIPYFVIARTFGIYDTYLILTIAYLTVNLPLAIFMMMSFFEEIPKEIEESAMVDGCSHLSAFRKIAVPLAAPGIVATAIFTFIFSWNDYLFALFLTQDKAGTLQLAVSWFIGEYAIRWGELSAAAVISTIPVIIFTIIIQKHLIRGLTLGAIKG